MSKKQEKVEITELPQYDELHKLLKSHVTSLNSTLKKLFVSEDLKLKLEQKNDEDRRKKIKASYKFTNKEAQIWLDRFIDVSNFEDLCDLDPDLNWYGADDYLVEHLGEVFIHQVRDILQSCRNKLQDLLPPTVGN